MGVSNEILLSPKFAHASADASEVTKLCTPLLMPLSRTLSEIARDIACDHKRSSKTNYKLVLVIALVGTGPDTHRRERQLMSIGGCQ